MLQQSGHDAKVINGLKEALDYPAAVFTDKGERTILVMLGDNGKRFPVEVSVGPEGDVHLDTNPKEVLDRLGKGAFSLLDSKQVEEFVNAQPLTDAEKKSWNRFLSRYDTHDVADPYAGYGSTLRLSLRRPEKRAGESLEEYYRRLKDYGDYQKEEAKKLKDRTKRKPERLENETDAQYTDKVNDYFSRLAEISMRIDEWKERQPVPGVISPEEYKKRMKAWRKEGRDLKTIKKELTYGRAETIGDLRNEIELLKRSSRNKDLLFVSKRDKVVKFLHEKLNKEAGEYLGAQGIRNIVDLAYKATSEKELDQCLRKIEYLINNAQYNAIVNDMNELIKTKMVTQDQRGVSKAISVDEGTRRLFDAIRSTFKGLLNTSLDSELREVRGEIARLGKQINESTDEEAKSVLRETQEELKQERDDLLSQREELLSSNPVESLEALNQREMELLDKMDQHLEGKGIFTHEMNDELNGLSIRKMLAEARQMELDIQNLEADSVRIRLKAYETAGPEKDKLLNDADANYILVNQAQEDLIRLVSEINRDLKDLISTGRSRLADMNRARMERRKDIVKMGIDAVYTGPIKPKNQRLTSIEQAKENVEECLNVSRHALASPLYSFNYLLKAIDMNHHLGQGDLYNYFMKSKDGVLEANDKRYKGIQQYRNELENKIKEIFKRKPEEVYRESNDTKIMKDFTLTDEKGNAWDIPLTKGQALYVWLTWRQDAGRAKLMHAGWTDSAIAEVEDFIGDEYREIGQWITDDFFPRLREERYNPIHVSMFGTSMASTPNYFPLSIDKSTIQEKGELGETLSGMPSTITGNIINRAPTLKPIDTTVNAFDLMYKYGTDMETWAAFSRVRQDLNFLRTSQAFRNYVNANDDGMFDLFIKSAEVAVHSFDDANRWDALNRVGRSLLRHWAGANIGYRIHTALKQTLSYPVFYAYKGDFEFYKDLTKYIVTMKANYDWALKNLPSFEERVDIGDLGVIALQSENQFKTALEKFNNKGMAPNKLIDALTCAAGARAVYNYEYRRAIKDGLSEEDASDLARWNAEIAFNETQQSSRSEFISPMQASSNVLYKAMTTYQTSNIGYQRMGVEGLLELARLKRLKSLDKLRGLSEEQAKKEQTANRLSAIMKAAMGLFIAGAVWNLGSYGTAYLTNKTISNLASFLGAPGEDDWLPLSKDDANALAVSTALGMVRGTSIGQLADALSTGSTYSPLSFIDDFQNEVKELSQDGLSYAVMKSIAVQGVKFKTGINIETWENMAMGVKMAILDGKPGLVSMMFMLNTPNSLRKDMAARLSKSKSPVEYAIRMREASKMYNDARMYLPFAKEVSSKRDLDILRRYFSDNLNAEDRDRYKKETEFAQLKREMSGAIDKDKWLEQHPEYEELKSQYGTMSVTKRIREDIRKTKSKLNMRDEGFKDISEVQKAYDTATSKEDRNRLKKYIEEGVDDEDPEEESASSEEIDKKSGNAYDNLSTGEDIMEDYRLKKTLAGLKKYHDSFTEARKNDPEAAARMYEQQKKYIEGYQVTARYRMALNRLKKAMGQPGADQKALMEQIRSLRREWRETLDDMNERK